MSESKGARRVFVLGLVLGALAAIPAALRGHEGHEHLTKGTIASVAEGKLVVETVDGSRNLYLLTGETRFLRGSAKTTRDDLVAGERVVVRFETREDGDRATEVRVGRKKP